MIAAVGFAGLSLALWGWIKQQKTAAIEPTGVRALAVQTVRANGLDVDPSMLVAMAWIESSFKPQATRYEVHLADASVGLMQTLRATARDMWAKGYKAFPNPDYADLTRPEVSLYFGAAYVDWLKKYHLATFRRTASEEWIVRAYNGGPGWQRSSARAQAMTANHWAKYQTAKRRLG